MQSRVVLLHVATGVPAKYHRTDAAGKEVEESKSFLGRVQAEFTAAGISAEAQLAYGEPAKEIVNWVQQNGCDLVAMSTHGHQLIADLVLGTTAIRVQHSLSVPVLLLRAK
jgi:nucleotide-binding universal stress UspA family protein